MAADSTRQVSVDQLVGRRLVVPGSTSNLACGFDAVGLALQVHLTLSIRDASDDGAARVTWQFASGPLNGENAIERGYRRGLDDFAPAVPVPSLVVDVHTDIPMRAGLGSSAAALVAGLRLAELVSTEQPVDRLLRVAASLEGHPDNTSASLLGGFVVAAALEDGSIVARPTPWPLNWAILVATPSLGLETKVARAALPSSYSLGDAVFNLQRVALLVDAVHREDAQALSCALADRLHQPYRAPLVPGLAEASNWPLRDGFLGAFLSGAGPSIAAFADRRVPGAVERTRHNLEALFDRLNLPVAVRTIDAGPVQRR
ncbi:MAG: homoserine kinase [Vicinamibacterales bacterium]